MNFKIPLKTFKINFQNSNIYELIGDKLGEYPKTIPSG